MRSTVIIKRGVVLIKKIICVITCMIFIFLSGCSRQNADNKNQTVTVSALDTEVNKPLATQNTENESVPKSNMTQYDNALIDSEYLLALATADDYLHAYMHRDVEEGMKYISEELIKVRGSEDIRAAISGISNPHHVSFEILGAKKIDTDTYRFNTWQYDFNSGDSSAMTASERPQCSYVDVTKYKVGPSEPKWLISGFGFE